MEKNTETATLFCYGGFREWKAKGRPYTLNPKPKTGKSAADLHSSLK